MIVVESGLSGLTNAYRSVLSYCGFPEMSGASRWLEAEAAPGSSVATPAAASPPAASAPHTRVARLLRPEPLLEIGVMPSVLSPTCLTPGDSERWAGRIGRISKLLFCCSTRVFGDLIRNPIRRCVRCEYLVGRDGP